MDCHRPTYLNTARGQRQEIIFNKTRGDLGPVGEDNYYLRRIIGTGGLGARNEIKSLGLC
jgi:hypothetical protein